MLSSHLSAIGRSFRTRGWRAVVAILMIAAAVAANAIVFSAVDGFVLRPLPFRGAERLVSIGHLTGEPKGGYWSEGAAEWRKVGDVFETLEAYSEPATSFVSRPGQVSAFGGVSLVTPELLSLLGVQPRWGRLWVLNSSADRSDEILISERLSRSLFGSPDAALAQLVDYQGKQRAVVGVMPETFRFPSLAADVWIPMTLEQWPSHVALFTAARLTEGVTLSEGQSALTLKSKAIVGGLDPRFANLTSHLVPLGGGKKNQQVDRLVTLVALAAAALLLIACANVASLELVVLDSQSRDNAVRAALGATPLALCRLRLTEGATIVLSGWVLGLLVATAGLFLLENQLSTAMHASLAKPLSLDRRVLFATAMVASLTWIASSWPIVARVLRPSVTDALRADTRCATTSRGAVRLKELLLAGQIFVTVVLLSVAIVSTRQYLRELGRDNGFDASNLAAVTVHVPPGLALKSTEVDRRLVERLRMTPWVKSMTRTSALPPSSVGGSGGVVRIDGRQPTSEKAFFHVRWVDPDYFRTMRISTMQGQPLDEHTPGDGIVIEAKLARRYWPNESPIGSMLSIGGGKGWGFGAPKNRIVGVIPDAHGERSVTGFNEEVFVVLVPFHADAYNNPYTPVRMIVRLATPSRLSELTAFVKEAAPGSVIVVETMTQRYERLYASERISALVAGGFGVLSLTWAAVGVYAVGAGVVRGRVQEIAIRLCLGAHPNDIARLMSEHTFLPVVCGLLLGGVASMGMIPLLAALIPGVQAPGLLDYVMVAAVILTPLSFALWMPVRKALKVMPMRTLRQA